MRSRFCFIDDLECVGFLLFPRTQIKHMKKIACSTIVGFVLVVGLIVLPVGCSIGLKKAGPKQTGGQDNNRPWSFIQIGDLHSGLVLRPVSWSNTVNAVLNNKTAWNLKLIVTPG